MQWSCLRINVFPPLQDATACEAARDAIDGQEILNRAVKVIHPTLLSLNHAACSPSNTLSQTRFLLSLKHLLLSLKHASCSLSNTLSQTRFLLSLKHTLSNTLPALSQTLFHSPPSKFSTRDDSGCCTTQKRARVNRLAHTRRHASADPPPASSQVWVLMARRAQRPVNRQGADSVPPCRQGGDCERR